MLVSLGFSIILIKRGSHILRERIYEPVGAYPCLEIGSVTFQKEFER